MQTTYSKLASAAGLVADGAHVRSLLASNRQSAEEAREIHHINTLAQDILVRGEFEVESSRAHIMRIRYDGVKATVEGQFTELGWTVKCVLISASSVIPYAAFEKAVLLRIERNRGAKVA